MQGKFNSILNQGNPVYKLSRCEATGEFVGTVYNPDTGQAIQRLRAQTERSLQTKLIKYIYSTVPMGNEIVSDNTIAIEATDANDSTELE